MRYLGALIMQAASFYTTLAFVAAITRPASDPQRWATTVGLAVAAEVVLFVMKEEMWRTGIFSKGVGIAGLLGDGFINAGGLGALAIGILTFGPAAFMLGALEVDMRDPSTMLWTSMGVSLALGLALSITPHILWRNTRSRGAVRQAA